MGIRPSTLADNLFCSYVLRNSGYLAHLAAPCPQGLSQHRIHDGAGPTQWLLGMIPQGEPRADHHERRSKGGEDDSRRKRP